LIPVSVAALTKGVLRMMWLTKFKTVLAVTLALATTAGLSAGLLSRALRADPPAQTLKADSAPKDDRPAPLPTPKPPPDPSADTPPKERLKLDQVLDAWEK